MGRICLGREGGRGGEVLLALGFEVEEDVKGEGLEKGGRHVRGRQYDRGCNSLAGRASVFC